MKKSLTKDLWVAGVLVAVLFAMIFVWVFFVGVSTGKAGEFFNKGKNAIWIAHEWASEKKSDAEIRELVSGLSSHGISTVFLHVGPLDEYGFINSQIYKETVGFVEKVRGIDPDMKILAWMGQVRGKLDLSSGAVRHNILNMCSIFTDMIGMDGVHYDIEPVWDNDEDFIKLLEETRGQFDKGMSGDEPVTKKILSVALAEFIPSSFVWWTGNVADYQNYNTEKNYSSVAKYADQIVDMVYDTGMDRDYIYRWFMREQVIWVGDLLGGDVEFLVGIPAYDEGEGHNPAVENVENALLGVLKGLNDIRSDESAFTGVAIYPEWEMVDTEWGVYDVLWGK